MSSSLQEIRNALLRLCEKENLKFIEADLKDKELVFKRIDNIFIFNTGARLEVLI